MELSTLNYPTSYVTSLILKDKELSVNELNDLHPTISRKQFGAIRKRLVRQGLVFEVIKGELDKVLTINDTEFSDDKVRAIILENPTLRPMQISELIPQVSWRRITGLRKGVFADEYRTSRLYKEVEVYRSAYLKSLSKNAYADKDFGGKNDVRNRVGELVLESGVFGLIGCLPHFDWLGEVFINKYAKNNTYLGIANNLNVFSGANIKKDLLGLVGSMAFGDVCDVISQYPSNSFAHINMDFCGVLPTQAKSVAYAIDNNLVQVGGYLFLTFTQRVRKVVKGDYALIFNTYRKMNNTKMTDSDFANNQLLKDLMTDKFTLVEKIPYKTKSPMVFYAIKRVK
jgi:hypothetical protein